MTDIRTLIRVAFVIVPHDGAERRVTAQADRLPDRHPDDAGRGLETFRLRLRQGERVKEEERVLPSLSLLKLQLTRELHRILNTVNHETERVHVIEDTHHLIQPQSCYCQFCGRKLLEHYGYLGAIDKKCPRCQKHTVCADAGRRPKRF